MVLDPVITARDALARPDAVLVDARPDAAAYAAGHAAGARHAQLERDLAAHVDDAARGDRDPFDPVAGHIPGARNAPYADNLRPDGTFRPAGELRAQLTAALDGIAPAQTIVHCGSGVTACHTLLALDRAGLTGARLYV